MRSNLSLVLPLSAALCLLGACANKKPVQDNEPALKSLYSAPAANVADANTSPGDLASKQTRAIEAYQKFLAVAPKAAQAAQATRRIGDLEMDRADLRSETGQGTAGPDYTAAISTYQNYLKAYPADTGNDRVLYQLARAQEQSGDLESALKTLNRLVTDYPSTATLEEAQFRHGELLFTTRDYPSAEKAYATVLTAGSSTSRYADRALYMQGWSQFKQAKLDAALHSFFGVLDIKVAKPANEALSRADQELVDDTFRVTSLCLSNLQGAESIPAYINSAKRLDYEPQVYEQLGELYLKQQRVKDAADTFALFAKLKPLNAQAPLLQARVIEVYQGNGFAGLALQAKKDYVARYGRQSEFRTSNPSGWEQAQTLVKTYLTELARYYHAAAQKSKDTADYQEAARWYRETLASFPDDAQSPSNNFLLAELLFEDHRYDSATAEYEKAAYGYALHAKAADAGYAALLGYTQQLKTADTPQAAALQKASVASALRFAKAFGTDPRTGPVLADAAEKLYAFKDSEGAAGAAQQVLDLQPAAAPAQRRVAYTVLAYTTFESEKFKDSELALTELLKLTPDTARAEIVERQAAAIYKQGEAARSAGNLQEAMGHFDRVALVAPNSSVRAAAQYDGAALRIALKDWDGATRELEDFRQRFPGNPLQSEVGGKLSLTYLEKGQWASAAAEFERLAANSTDTNVARSALWQAAELYQKSNADAAAAKVYERYVAQYPQPLEPALEARNRLAKMATSTGNSPRTLALMKDIFDADQSGGGSRTDRTRYLGATAALALAEPLAAAYRKVALTEPLQKQLKLKKARMEEALKAYGVATDYGVADVTTAATYHIATVYQDFAKALIASERPKKLSKLEREQYDVLLEEQAFPFEEQATQMHETNARRAHAGIYDTWVQNSFAALAQVLPVRYGKVERTDGGFSFAPDLLSAPDTTRAWEEASRAGPRQAAYLNDLGVAYRKAGKFDWARQTYDKAIALDPTNAAPLLNQGILTDLYVGDASQAQALYTRYLALVPGDATVLKWQTELKNRKPAPESKP